MRKLTKIMLPEVGIKDLKIRSRSDNRCESAKYTSTLRSSSRSLILRHASKHKNFAIK